MKKLILLLIALSMLVCLFACEKTDGEIEENGTKEDEKLENFENNGRIEFFSYFCDAHGGGISTKTVADRDESYSLVDALNRAKETGETIPKISNDVLDVGLTYDYPVEIGTKWIESMGRIYRVAPDYSQICRVETHFGEGKALEMTDELKIAIEGAWNYSPYYSYSGTYTAGDETVELKVTNESDSLIRMSVKDIYVGSARYSENTITMELTSSEDREISVKLRCAQSSDNYGMGDEETVLLKKDIPVTVELKFGGFTDYYWIYITAGYTMATIHITETEVFDASCLSYENGRYFITLPKSQKKLTLLSSTCDYTSYIPYITDELVATAESKITDEISRYDNTGSGFYLYIKEGYLCLALEVIEHLDEPNEKGEDHEHVFFIERISSKALDN